MMGRFYSLATVWIFVAHLCFASVQRRSTGGCNDGYSAVGGMGMCLRFYRQTRTWFEARKLCQSEGGSLAVIDNIRKRDAVLGFLKKNGFGNFWVDAFELRPETGSWYWNSTGGTVDRNLWLPGEPNDHRGPEGCMQFIQKGEGGLNDASCTEKNPFICEIKMDKIKTFGGNANGKVCQFPFTYRGNSKTTCITDNYHHPWCATTDSYDKDGQWGICLGSVAKTTGGTSDGAPCVVPFRYKGRLYTACTSDGHDKPWCATSPNYDTDRKWGVCLGDNDCNKANYQLVAGMCLNLPTINKKSWSDGKKTCGNDNCDLGAFDTMEKFNSLRLYLEAHGVREITLWVNGRQEEQYHWTWRSTNKTVNPFIWESGVTYTQKCMAYRQRNKVTTTYRYTQTGRSRITSTTTSRWVYGMIDVKCNQEIPYICEYKGVDGQWGEWGSWSNCTSCSGNKTRHRECNKPPTRFGGKDCPGENSETEPCKEKCDGKGHTSSHVSWGTWSDWSSCSAPCGQGSQTRTRQCGHPSAQYGSNGCSGSSTKTKSCNDGPCPVDAVWSVWTHWSACSKTCGQGNSTRHRACNSPPPSNGGKNCQGKNIQTNICNREYCPVDGGWAAWGSWSSCTVSCGGGTRIRRRSCTNPKPEHGGKACPINAGSESEQCALGHCPTCQVHAVSGSTISLLSTNTLKENDQVRYFCKPEHTLISGSLTRTCLANGTLTGEEPVCQKCCGKARFILNGHPDTEDGLCYGDTVSYICDRGYKISNNSPVMCTMAHTWANTKLPTCEADGKCNSSDLDSPEGGYKACSGDDLDKVCYMHCPTGQEYTQKHSVFQCNANTGWAWKVPLGDGEKHLSAVVGKCQVSDDASGLELFLGGPSISLPSSKPDAALKLEIEKRMLQELLAKKICTDPCKIKDIEIERVAFHAYRRAVPQEKRFGVKITLYAAPAKGSITTQQSARLELSKTLKLLTTKAAELKQTILANKMTLQIDGAPVVLEGNNIQISKPSLACPDGSIRKAFNCYTCPEGTYHDIAERQCISCPFGQYQDQPGQMSCKPCPSGTTTDKIGVNNVTRCKEYAGCDCGIHPCSFNGTKLECDCLPGYEKKNGTCKDIDECLSDVCPTNSRCINKEGSYRCECLPGFEGGSCIDINECKFPSTCPYPGMLCNNTVGSFTCTCKRGLYGDHCDQKCPPMFSQKQNTCLFISKTMLSYDIGARLCSGISPRAHLVHIKDKGKYKTVTNTLQSQWSYWIGMDDKAKEGEFVFTDGTKLGSSYSEWGAGSNDPTKNCVIMDGPDSFMWKVVDCNGKHLAVCEVEIM